MPTVGVSIKKSAEVFGRFAVTAILLALTNALPFYPAELMIILALGVVGVKSPPSGLMVGTILTVIAAMYQGELVGLTFFIVPAMLSGSRDSLGR
jgi:hypothetical protein